MNVLVWQWGRRGAGPRFAADLAEGLRGQAGLYAALSLSRQAEILRGGAAPPCALPFSTYRGLTSAVLRTLTAPQGVEKLVASLRPMQFDLAICAMPAALDFLMQAALARLHVPVAAVVHDADTHPGDGFPLQMLLQRRLVRRADAVVVLSHHVGARLAAQGLAGPHNLVVTRHPPFAFGPLPPRPRAHGGKVRFLFFGRLLPYKGLDLLAEAWRHLGPREDMELRVVGRGPNSATLTALAALPGVTVENRWVPEPELGALIGWADALVLSYREASQSGVAAAAVGAGRWVVATRVGGIVEQLGREPLARLCEPDPIHLAATLATLADHPPPPAPATNARLAWRHAAAGLLSDIEGVVAARKNTAPRGSAAALAPISAANNRVL
jgi:glycosyltransferase involved in cell wall biosynthesis